MLKNYIIQLKQQLNCTYPELAKKLDVSFEHLTNIKNGRRETISLSLLGKLSKLENRQSTDILYDILFMEDEKQLLEDHSKQSLQLLCHLYLNNYVVNANYSAIHPVTGKELKFEGYAYKKRDIATSLLIDSWDTIVKEYYASIKTQTDKENSFFANSKEFIHSVYIHAVSKFLNCSPLKTRKYVILISNENIFKLVSCFNIKSATLHLVPILISDKTDFKDLTNLKVIK